jgi:hypothetical protein
MVYLAVRHAALAGGLVCQNIKDSRASLPRTLARVPRHDGAALPFFRALIDCHPLYALLDLHDDCRPVTEHTAADRNQQLSLPDSSNQIG